MDIEKKQRESPEYVNFLRTEHVHSTDPDYWQAFLKQISTLWWTPLDYSAEDFQKITEPALILLGDRDGIIDLDQAVEMYQLIPHADLAILPNRTHITALDQLFTGTVLDFLLRHK